MGIEWRPAALVWENTIDGKFYASVVRTDNDKGILIITEKGSPFDTIIHQEKVGLAYGAQFGPDEADVHEWMIRVEDVVDHPEKRSK